MWRTSEGEPAPHGGGWSLFRNGSYLTRNFVHHSFQEPGLASFGLEAFDRIEASQKLAAHTEATVAAVCRATHWAIETEMHNFRHLEAAEIERS